MTGRLTTLTCLASCLLMMNCCGKPTATFPVERRVVFPDGSPAADGTIEFETMNGRKPMTVESQIGQGGRFKPGAYAPGDGDLPGTHRVAVIADYQIGTKMERPELILQRNDQQKVP